MFVECLIRRVGPTPLELGKTRYMFMPVPDPKRKSGEPSTSICDISSEEHLEFLLKNWNNPEKKKHAQFRPWADGQEAVEEKVINMSGYSIVKHQDGRAEGYRIENINVKPKQYAGNDGEWKTNTQSLSPFDTEFSAWQWLKEELEFQETPVLEMSQSSEEAAKVDELLKNTKRK